MKQIIEVKGFHVPWHLNDQKRPIFSTKAKRDEFLDAYATGYEKAYVGLDFNPEQETLVLSPQAFTVEAIKAIKKINYVRVRTYLGTATPDGLLYEFFYFVTSNTLPPIYDFDGSGESTGTIPASIKLDVWLTYVYPANITRMQAGTFIEQSTKINGAVGATSRAPELGKGYMATAGLPMSQSPVMSFEGRSVAEIPPFGKWSGNYDYNIFSARPPAVEYFTKENCFYFVGLFSLNNGLMRLLARPIGLYSPQEIGEESENPNNNELPPSAILQVQRGEDLSFLCSVSALRYCDITSNGFVATELTDEASGSRCTLMKAYLIPRRLIKELSTDTETGIGKGYEVRGFGGDNQDVSAGTAFAIIDALKNKEIIEKFSIPVPFGSEDITDEEEAGECARFVDVGTVTTRLQVTPPEGGDAFAVVKFISSFGIGGFSLIMDVGGRQIDLAKDFEIPIENGDEARMWALQNRWSYAMQGVSAVGGAVSAIATKNPMMLSSTLLSAGQYMALKEAEASPPATVIGQGNGNLTRNTANERADDGGTLGAVFARFAFKTIPEANEVERWGYKWESAQVTNETTFSRDLFLNGRTTREGRGYIKTAGCLLSFSSSYNKSEGEGGDIIAIPQKYEEELEALFDKGITIYYDAIPLASQNDGGFGG